MQLTIENTQFNSDSDDVQLYYIVSLTFNPKVYPQLIVIQLIVEI